MPAKTAISYVSNFVILRGKARCLLWQMERKNNRLLDGEHSKD